MMKTSKSPSFGRQLLRSVLVVSGVSLAAMAIGCGSAATEATIDTSVPEDDPTAMGTDADAALDTESAPETPETPAE